MDDRPAIRDRNDRLTILYQDSDVVVVDKPAGVLTHVHQFDRAAPHVQAIIERTLGMRVHIVHRLDRMTSGVLVIALGPDAASNLSAQFRDRTVGKRYIAVVRGHAAESSTVRTSLEVRPGERADAETSFETIERGTVHEPVGRYDEAWFSLLRVRPSTGRRHQIRRHLHSIDHPILGDTRHGDKNYNRWAAARFGVRYLYLRATELAFDHPAGGGRITVIAGLPPRWQDTLRTIFPGGRWMCALSVEALVDTMQPRD